MENNIVCSRCGSANVRCEAMVNPNTKGFDHFTDEAFYYGWCENCGLGVALTDKEEVGTKFWRNTTGSRKRMLVSHITRIAGLSKGTAVRSRM